MTKAKKIDKKGAYKALKAAVALKGADYVDPNSKGVGSCTYFSRTKTPLCIVGTAFSIAGVEVPFSPRSRWNKQAVGDLAYQFPDLFTKGALDVLSAAQSYQDTGHTWGLALAAARAQMK